MARNKYDIDEELNSQFNIRHLYRLFGYIRPYRNKVIFTVCLMLFSSVSALLGPFIAKIALDSSIPAADITGLVLLSVLFAASIVFSGLCQRFRMYTMSQIGQSVLLDIRLDLFKHLQKLPFSYYDSRPHGKILVRVVNYVNSLSDLLSNGIVNLLTDLFTLILIVVFMLVVNTKLALVSMSGLPVVILAIFILKNAQRKAWQSVSRKLSNMNAYIHESICGIKITQSFSREEVNAGIFGKLNRNYFDSWMKAVKLQFLLEPLFGNVSTICICLVYVYGISLLAEGVTIGVIIAFIWYIMRFWAPISNIGNFYNSIIQAIAYLERIYETIDEKVDVDNLPGAGIMPAIRGAVEFRDVSFNYEDGQEVLHEINFKVEPGETIALVGPTGAGKSTIVNLISRFYDVSSGAVLIDGIDVKDVTLDSLRKQMGIMMQDTFIFSGTILDNIRYGKLDATDEEVIAASRAVMADIFINRLKDKYKTEVNERGSRLSTGQRQLLSFARALLADPRILILDEATSSIDSETERALQEGLNKLLKGRTSFIIAHRLSTIKNSSRILYIDEGRIVEQGTHNELLKMKGAYYDLYMSQFTLDDAVPALQT